TLRRRACRHADRYRTDRIRTAAGCAGARALRLGHGRTADAGTPRRSAIPADARLSSQRAPAMKSPAEQLVPGRALTLAGVADGAEGMVVADLARAAAAKPGAPAVSLVVVCRDGQRLAQLSRALAFFAPDVTIHEFPAWDCQPYDRVSPHAAVVAQRMTTLSRLARLRGRERPAVLLTTVNAVLQRVPARDIVAKQALSAAPGNV